MEININHYADMVHEGKEYMEIKSQLKADYPEISRQDIKRVMDSVDNEIYMNKRKGITKENSNTTIYMGLFVMFAGIFITVFTYIGANAGDHYVVTWGLIFAGFMLFVAGYVKR